MKVITILQNPDPDYYFPASECSMSSFGKGVAWNQIRIRVSNGIGVGADAVARLLVSHPTGACLGEFLSFSVR